jgi:hypothetical protein
MLMWRKIVTIAVYWILLRAHVATTEYGASAIHHRCYTRNGLIQGVCIGWSARNNKAKTSSTEGDLGGKAWNFTPWLATDEALGLLSEVIGRV